MQKALCLVSLISFVLFYLLATIVYSFKFCYIQNCSYYESLMLSKPIWIFSISFIAILLMAINGFKSKPIPKWQILATQLTSLIIAVPAIYLLISNFTEIHIFLYFIILGVLIGLPTLFLKNE